MFSGHAYPFNLGTKLDEVYMYTCRKQPKVSGDGRSKKYTNKSHNR